MLLESEIIDYKENKQKIEHWVILKGEYRYETIINFLKEKSIDCTWNNVTCYIKYDKRILINSFKYIVFLEEFLKSALYNFNKKINVRNLEFSNAVSQYLSLENKVEFDNMNIKLLAIKKESLIAFRNSVVHNKILLNKTFKNETLEQILKIFMQILPDSYKKGFIEDINSCSKNITDNLWHITLNNEN